MRRTVVALAIRDVSQTLQAEAGKLFTLFEAMQQEVTLIAKRTRDPTIVTFDRQFSAMRPAFERVRADIQNYSWFLSSAADEYVHQHPADKEATRRAMDQLP